MYRIFIFMFFSTVVYGQSTHLSPHDRSAKIMERWLIMQDSDHNISSSLRNYYRKDAITLSDGINVRDSDLSYIFANNSEYVDNDNYIHLDTTYHDDGFKSMSYEGGDVLKTRSPILKHFYKTEANFFQLDLDNFKLRLNPIINFQFGNDKESNNPIFQNTRGIEVRGTIDDKVYFYSTILENQARFYNYLETRLREEQAVPGGLLYKTYKSSISDKISGWDYLIARGYVGYNLTKSISIELGHDTQFIGDGIHSLLLSDYAPPSLYLKFNTRIWKINYQNIFSELSPISAKQQSGDRLLPKKYTATHYLSIQPAKGLEVGLFESIIFARQDHFEFQYLNPIIFYRTIEHSLDSPDNAMLGLNVRYNLLKKYQVYGQLLLDEFKISEFTSDDGWWGNKYGVQLGLKAVNLFNIDHLDFQYEFNRVRPYTYGHRSQISEDINQSIANYSHYNQPLAHPLGANFTEHNITFRYRPTSRLFLEGSMLITDYGDDNELYYGRSILTPNTQRISDYGIEQGQGVSVALNGLYLSASYELWNNLFLDLNFIQRKDSSTPSDSRQNTSYIGGGLRFNLFETKRYY